MNNAKKYFSLTSSRTRGTMGIEPTYATAYSNNIFKLLSIKCLPINTWPIGQRVNEELNLTYILAGVRYIRYLTQDDRVYARYKQSSAKTP